MAPKKKMTLPELGLSYTKIHTPPKMKSVYWRYFGFPADDNDCIITKQKVVCTLCHTVLTNHSNTTNIRSHIQSNHKEIFSQLIAKHSIYVPPRKTKPNVKLGKRQARTTSRPFVQKMESSNSSLIEEDSISILEAIPLTYEDTDRMPKGGEDLSATGTSNLFVHQVNDAVASLSEKRTQKSMVPYNITVDINPIQIPVDYNIEEALRKMIVKDVLNISSLYCGGMQEFVSGFLSNQIIPPLSQMESSMKQIYSEKLVKLKDRIKAHSQMKPYSLSFDVWTNVEDRELASIYFNNISDDFDHRFCNNLYLTIELDGFTLLDEVFDGFNLENCSAAVVNCNNRTLNTFLSNNDIPIVHCFSYIVNECIASVFEIPEVSQILNEVLDVIRQYGSEICSEEDEIPTVCKGFPLTLLSVFRFFCESMSWPDELQGLLSRAKPILNALSPVEITLETLKEEDLPLCSLFAPFANRIIEKHFSFSETDDVLLQEVKMRVVSEFKRSVCSNSLLTVTALLDPRFHKFLSMKSVNTCVNMLDVKYSQISKQRGYLQKCAEVKAEPAPTSRKSNLKMFFDCSDEPTRSKPDENFIEHDLRLYREEAFASLEENPIMWWNQWGNMYGSLRHLADVYNCILGFVTFSERNSLKDQIDFHRKRSMLTGKSIEQILFLNKNGL